MTLQEAIEVKEAYHQKLKRHMLSKERLADKLSIEALLCLKRMRSLYTSGFSALLPGETED